MEKMTSKPLAKSIIIRLLFLVMLTFSMSALLVSGPISDQASQQKRSKAATAANATADFNLLPDGQPFAFWDDQTTYSKVLHVAQNNPQASDNNPGTLERPLKTINAAAQLLQPGEKVIVHEGIYREHVIPARGGTAANKMIAYEVASGEKVIVKGSEVWKPQFRPSIGFGTGRRPLTTSSNATPIQEEYQVWMGDLPASFFVGYNPFSVRNTYRFISRWGFVASPEWMSRVLLYRGAVFADGKPLKQVLQPGELAQNENAFWVEDPGLRLHIRLAKGVDPATLSYEVTAREQIFAPKEFGLSYIRVSGFAFEHSADGPPVPQRAAVSAMRGHHWIIENNRIEWCNATGIDLGTQDFGADRSSQVGDDIVRNNIIRNIGMCGISGPGLNNILFENNLVEYIGLLDMEENRETGGMKLHNPRNTLIRNNIFRHIDGACGIWFDIGATNCRIANNVFADIETIDAAIWMEMHFEQNLIDHNIFWDIHNDPTYVGYKGSIPPGTVYSFTANDNLKSILVGLNPPNPKETEWAFGNGTAIRADCNEKMIVAHNFFGKCPEHAVSLNIFQKDRLVGGRLGLGFNNKVFNNIFYETPNRIYVAKKYENKIDGNLYDRRNASASFLLVYPEPVIYQNLAGWQEYFGWDTHSTEASITADFDPEACILEISIEGKLPECQSLSSFISGKVISSGFVGPFLPNPDKTQLSQQIIRLKQKFPMEL